MAQRWASAGGGHRGRARRGHVALRPARCSRSPIPTASPRTAAAAARSCSPTGAARAVDPASALAREPYLAVAELTGTAAQGRILLAAPITLAEIEARFADQIESARRGDVRSRRDGLAARARKRAGCGAIALAERRWRSQPDGGNRAGAGRGLVAARPRQAAVDRRRCKQWRDRVMFLRKAEGDEWPDLSDAALAAQRERLAGAGARRQDRAEASFRPAICREALMTLLPWELRARLERRSADPFRGADRHRSVPIDYEAEQGPTIVDPRAGTVRARRAIRRSPAGACRWCWNCCRRRTGRCR